MRAKIYPLLENCVEEGVRRGYGRAFKHIEDPSEETIVQSIVDCIMITIAESFDFDDITAI